MSPNLDVHGVTNQLFDSVSFVDTDPSSPTFHRVLTTTAVGRGPRGIAWDPLDEDVLVCNEASSSLSVISAATLAVRKEVHSHLSQPFEVCVTPRQFPGYGFSRNIYLAYILNRTGDVAVFESGPDGNTGWGYDDVLGVVPFRFQNPKAIQFDRLNMDASVYVLHEGPIDPSTGQHGPLGEGAVSRLRIDAAIAGQLALATSSSTTPIFRDMIFGVPTSLGSTHLSGIPIDLAFDVQKNIGGLQAPASPFGSGPALPANGKQVTRTEAGQPLAVNQTRYLFVSVPNAPGTEGVIDVLDLASAGFARADTNPYEPGVQSIEVPGVGSLADYFRQ